MLARRAREERVLHSEDAGLPKRGVSEVGGDSQRARAGLGGMAVALLFSEFGKVSVRYKRCAAALTPCILRSVVVCRVWTG
jgi:hypothetical protein